MTVTYNPETDFQGRIYMEGYSDHPECYASGQGKNTVVSLKLPLLTSQCGITKANGDLNRSHKTKQINHKIITLVCLQDLIGWHFGASVQLLDTNARRQVD